MARNSDSSGYVLSIGGGGGGGGTGPEDWTEVDLDVSNFHIMKKNGELWRWSITNPSAGVLRIKIASNGSGGIWESDQQEGPVLVVPAQIVPRTFANPAGVTGNQWRSEDCRLYIEMDVGVNGFLNDGSGNGAPYGTALQVGPIICCYDTDHGTGAAFRTANPIPKFDSYTHVMMKKDNPKNAHTWRHAFTLGRGTTGEIHNDNQLTNPVGSAGQPNRLCLQVGGMYKRSQADQGGNREVGATASSIDSRVEDGGFSDWWSFLNHHSDRNRIEDMYVYVGIAAGQWNYSNDAYGTYLDITGFRYRVQPVKNRSL